MKWLREAARHRFIYLQSERIRLDQYEKSQTKQYGKIWADTLASQGNRLMIAWLDFRIELHNTFIKR